MAGASLRISTPNRNLVTWAFGWVFVALAGSAALPQSAFAVDEIVATGEIEAKAYDIRTIRPSRSGRVYLFEMGDEGLPVDGKIFLLRQGDTPVMALRVLKTYPDSKRIAAKRLRTYPSFETLTRNSRYRAFEKIGDVVAPVPPSPEDVKDLQDLESNAIEELPPEAPPEALAETTEALEEIPAEETPTEEAPPEAPPAEESAPEESAPAEDATAFDDGEPGEEDLELRRSESEDEFDAYFPNQLTMAVGLFPKWNVPGPSRNFGGGLMYSRDFSRTLAVEGAFFYFKSTGTDSVTGNSVTSTMIPMMANVRLQRPLAEHWMGYLYGGLVYPKVSASIGARSRLIREIQVLRPALGVGAFLQTGPNWYLRINLGLESMTLGVSLRY